MLKMRKNELILKYSIISTQSTIALTHTSTFIVSMVLVCNKIEPNPELSKSEQKKRSENSSY